MIYVLIADDHPLMRDALKACLEDEPDIMVAAEVVNGNEALQAARRLPLDVIILDLYLPDIDGIHVLQAILEDKPEARILVFTSSTDEDKIAQAIQSGALGYLIKDSPREELLHAIREVSQGHSYLSAVVAGKLASVLRQKRAANVSSVLEPLTQREENILALVRSGASNTAISRALNISETTVSTHIYHILQKMGLKNRSELLMYLLQQREGLK
jgi:DNA-binding NarL/FixJ family response regulator